LNVSGSGVSMSMGPRGASVTLGKRGIYRNLGLPGTGIYHRTRLAGGKDTTQGSRGATRREIEAAQLQQFFDASPSLKIPLAGGDVLITGVDGEPLSMEIQAIAWKHHGDELLNSVVEACAGTIEAIKCLQDLHIETPAPVPPRQFQAVPFRAKPPLSPTHEPYHCFLRVFPQHRAARDSRNEWLVDKYAEETRYWEQKRTNHQIIQADIEALFVGRDSNDPDAVERFLAWVFSEITWPKET